MLIFDGNLHVIGGYLIVANIHFIYDAEENKLNEMEMMKKFQNIHLKIYQTTFQPDRRDWRQMTELIKHQDATSALLTKIENILRKKKKPPVFPISYILACLKPEPTTVKEVMKDLAKAMRPKRRLKFD